MNKFQPENFFDLSVFPYKDVFLLDQPVWQTLKVINNFCQEFFKNFKGKLIKGEVQKGAVLLGEDIFIDGGTVVESGSMIKGPTIIDKNCQIRHGAYIRGRVLIGNGSVIGNSTEIKNSILLRGVKAAHLNYIGDSVVGNKVNLGGGVKLANFRLDGRKVKINFQGRKIATGLTKLGSILGDGVSVGCNTVCNPGTILGRNSKVYPLISVKGFHKSGSIIKKDD